MRRENCPLKNFASPADRTIVPSSRASRRSYKVGSGRPTPVEGYTGEEFSTKRYVGLEARAANKKKRAAIATEFGQLTPPERHRQASAFRKALRVVCTSDAEFKGFWALQMEPKLADDHQARTATSPTQRKAMPPGSAAIRGAAIDLVRANPEKLTQKQCVMVLKGSDDAAIRTGEWHRVPQYGRFTATSRKKLSAELTSLIASKSLERLGNGRLRAGGKGKP